MAGGLLVLEAMGRDGRYRSQFETGTSNGGLTAYPGGGRWSWESRIFGAAYDDAPAAERPAYGSLNFRRRTGAVAPVRVLAPAPAAGHAGPDDVLLPGQLHRARPFRRGRRHVAHRAGRGRRPRIAFLWTTTSRPRCTGRGALRPGTSRRSCSIPALRGTRVEERIARGLRCPAEWHGGFRLAAAELAGVPGLPRPAVRPAGDRDRGSARQLDPRGIGSDPVPAATTSKHLKRVWHYVARFGSPD